MRKTLTFAAALLLTAAAASAQDAGAAQELPPQPPVTGSHGTFDVGFRGTDVTGDPTRVQRYRDISDGALADRFRYEQRSERWIFESGAQHLGLQDQRAWATFRSGGKVKMSFQWDQIPLFVSGDTKTLFTTAQPGVLRLSDTMQSGIQNAGLPLTGFVGGAQSFDVQSRRDTASFDLIYTPVPTVNVNLNVKHARRSGTTPFGASFGFNDAVEVAAPVETRTTDIASGIEYSGSRGMMRVGYDGSWFDNQMPTLVWDNPLKLNDATSATNYVDGLGGSQGRAAMPPSNTMQGLSTAGALKLPASTRLTANVTVGTWRQNEPLLPVTINAAVPEIALPRPTANGDAQTLAMNYTFTSQPGPYLWLHGAYRSYDFDNRTPVFQPAQFVVFDQTAHPGVPTEPTSFGRRALDLDAALLPAGFTSFRVGYTRTVDDHTYRIFSRTTEDTYRSSIDLGAGTQVLVRGIVERSKRVGSHLDEEMLIEVGEQPALRHYDIADRNRDRATGLLQISPSKYFGLTASAALGKDDYVNSGFGLRNNDNRMYSLTADFAAGAALDGTVSYVNERYTALQNSRTANPGTPQVTDPTRDWSIDSADTSETWGATVAALKLIPRMELRAGYDLTRSDAAYVYGVPADSTIPALVQLPTIHNQRRTATADVRVKLTRTLGIGLFYWHETFEVDDFAFSPAAIGSLATPGSLFLGEVFLPYRLNSATLRLMLAW
jgi:MtrB/PioB family decaheme-associated outer membrane protein